MVFQILSAVALVVLILVLMGEGATWVRILKKS